MLFACPGPPDCFLSALGFRIRKWRRDKSLLKIRSRSSRWHNLKSSCGWEMKTWIERGPTREMRPGRLTVWPNVTYIDERRGLASGSNIRYLSFIRINFS